MNTGLPSAPHPAAARLWSSFAAALAALIISLLFHSPRLWIFTEPRPGSTYWDRGLQFIQQCDLPLGAPLADAGLTWRLAPVLLAKGLGLHGYASLAVPWIGLLLLLSLVAWIVRDRTDDAGLANLATALVGTTASTLTVTGWLGMNDAWYAAALLAVAFAPARAVLAAAAVTGPWIDERFILALPQALFVRHLALGPGWRPGFSLASAGLGVAANLIARGLNLPGFSVAPLDGYAAWLAGGAFVHWLPWAGLGWFMGLRAAWALAILTVVAENKRTGRRSAIIAALLAAAPLFVITLLAADTGRAATMLLPLVVLGVERLAAWQGVPMSRRILGGLLAANLLMPAMHVTYKDGDLINSLPVEIARLLRQP